MSQAVPPTVAADYTLPWLLELLVGSGDLSDAQRRDIEVKGPPMRARLAKQQAGEAPGGISPAEVVAGFQLVDTDGHALDEDRVAQRMAEAVGLPYRKIDPLKLDMPRITATLSRPFALRHGVLPLELDDTTLTVAVENPLDTEVIDNLRRTTSKDVVRVLASKRDIVKCITEIYGFRRSVESAAKAEGGNEGFYDFEQLVRLRSVGEIEGTDQHVVNAVEYLFRYAFDQRASDIHIEPRREHAQVRLRIDGVLHDVHAIPRRVQPAVVSRIKALSRLDIAERRRPQDGRIKTMLGDKGVEMRVSTLPTAFGEKLVLRIFDPEVLQADLPALGFEGADLATFQRWIAAPHGLILITGPTGSGKTTTLYATLKALADDTVNITTVEDPIEMVSDTFNQVAVQAKIGMDFATSLRSILRQDPDIIMVGEVRDGETAEMAVQAALTGHLVFSTLHTNDTASAVTRLIDLDVPRFLVSNTVVGVMAQRLLRRLCVHCCQASPLDVAQCAALDLAPTDAGRPGARRAVGCARCRGTGYFGRVGIFEMLDCVPAVRQEVQRGASAEELARRGEEHGMRSLRACALDRLWAGLTSFDEVVRVTGLAQVAAPAAQT